MEQATKLRQTYRDPVAEPEIQKVIRANWKRNRRHWERAGLELDDLYQMVREKFWHNTAKLEGKGLGYRIKTTQHFLSDRLDYYRTRKHRVEGELVDEINHQFMQSGELRKSSKRGCYVKVGRLPYGIDERELQERVNLYRLSQQKLAGIGYRVKYWDGMRIVYDIRYWHWHRCFIDERRARQWMLLDVLLNDRGCTPIISLWDRLLIKVTHGLRELEGDPELPLPRMFEGDTRWLDEIEVSERWIDRDR